MKSSIFINSLSAALLLSPVLVSAQPPDPAQNRPNAERPGVPPAAGRGPAAGQGMMRRGGEAGGPMQPGPMQRRQALKAELGLTEAQQADLRKAAEGAKRDRLRKTTDLKIAKMDLRSLLRADKVDEKAVAAKLAEAQAAEGALMKLRVDTVLAMKRILTPDQQKKLEQMRAARRGGRMGQRMKMRGQNRGMMMNRMRGMNGARPMGQGGMPGMGPGMRDQDPDLDLDLDQDLEDDLGQGGVR